jgi:cytochrome c biogenesis protein CcmG/thiol:disulfide interchange protein DsbE
MRRLHGRWLAAGLVAAALGVMVGGTPSCASPGKAVDLDYVLQDMDGHSVKLENLRGRPILLNFWATWCGPCKAEIPWFVEFADKYRGRLAVVGVSVDDAPEDMRTFASTFHVNYPLLVGAPERGLRVKYEADEVIPISWLIRADGTVQAKAQGIHPKAWFESNLSAMLAAADEY